MTIENRGKSLTFLKLCEEWGIGFKIECVETKNNESYGFYNKHYIYI